jgi:pimeloyl-ACP methyl ester carboxylesterase
MHHRKFINRLSNHRQRTFALGLVALLALSSRAGIAATDLVTPESKAVSATSDCYVEDLPDRLRCGFITVPENTARPDGRQIDIHYMILPAIKNTHPDQALLAIAGGPGQSAIDNAAYFDRLLSKVRQQRDILLIDQRGTGRSNGLQCPDEALSAFDINDEHIDAGAEAAKCLAKLDADVSQYGSQTALTDFEAVRRHLGYAKLHLYGISYGTRMAQLYMRHYPQVLSTVTLDGVVPMQQSVLAIGQAIDRGFELLLQDCRDTRACAGQFPQLDSELAQVDARLAAAPYSGEISDPLTGETTQLTLTRNKFLGAIRMALYMPSTRALLPHAIHQAYLANYRPILGLYALTLDSAGMAMGMHASVVCGEDLPRVTDELLMQLQASHLGRSLLKASQESCAQWQMPTVAASFSEPITGNIPTLLLSGERDPATPPAWGEMAMVNLGNAKHLVSPYATHGVAAQSCATNLIDKLVNTGDVSALNGECLNKDVRRSFYLNASTVEVIPSQELVPTDADKPSRAGQDINLNVKKTVEVIPQVTEPASGSKR